MKQDKFVKLIEALASVGYEIEEFSEGDVYNNPLWKIKLTLTHLPKEKEKEEE